MPVERYTELNGACTVYPSASPICSITQYPANHPYFPRKRQVGIKADGSQERRVAYALLARMRGFRVDYLDSSAGVLYVKRVR